MATAYSFISFWTTLQSFFYWMGLFTAQYLALFFLFKAFRTLSCFIPRDLLTRYGKNSWIIVTGASDGIGKGFCTEFAKQGFNIVLVARNLQKLNKVATELRQLNSNIKTQIVVADFSNSADLNLFDSIVEQIKDLDISILINNVGVYPIYRFGEMSEQDVKDTVIVNTLPQVMLTHKLIKRLSSRKNRSAIINVSSMMANTPMPYFPIYCATKVFNDYFSRSLAGEHPNIDITCLRPAFVSTTVVSRLERNRSMISVDECVKGFLNKLGRETGTSGHWKHELLSVVIRLLPDWMASSGTRTKGLEMYNLFEESERSANKKD